MISNTTYIDEALRQASSAWNIHCSPDLRPNLDDFHFRSFVAQWLSRHVLALKAVDDIVVQDILLDMGPPLFVPAGGGRAMRTAIGRVIGSPDVCS